MTNDYRIGDIVEIRWGFGSTQGVIEELQGPSASPHALVRVTFLSTSGQPNDEETTVRRLDELKLVRRSA